MAIFLVVRVYGDHNAKPYPKFVSSGEPAFEMAIFCHTWHIFVVSVPLLHVKRKNPMHMKYKKNQISHANTITQIALHNPTSSPTYCKFCEASSPSFLEIPQSITQNSGQFECNLESDFIDTNLELVYRTLHPQSRLSWALSILAAHIVPGDPFHLRAVP